MKLQIAALALIAAAASPAFAAPATFRGLQDTCAAEGERSQECPGVDNPTRPTACCDGLVCSGPRCEKPDACAAEGEKAIECGINQVNRPAECCPGLSCNADKFCVPGGDGPATLPEVEPEPDATPAPTPMTSKDFEDSGEPTASPVAASVLPEPTDCGLEGAKTEQCGADAKPGRFATCCPGYICDFDVRQCIKGESKPPTPAPQCGVVGAKTEECGADAKPGRWAECCPGLECDFDIRECIPGPPTPMPTGMPTMAVTEGMVGTSYCTFSPDFDCYEKGWPACCGDDSVECPAEQPECEIEEETPEPTSSTDEPTAGAEPTMAPTIEEQPPSAAGVLVTGFATVGAVVAPLLLL